MKTTTFFAAPVMLLSLNAFALDFTTSAGNYRLTEEVVSEAGLAFVPESTSLNFGAGVEQSFGKFKIGASALTGNVNYNASKPQDVLDALADVNADIAAETDSVAALNTALGFTTDPNEAADIQAQIKDGTDLLAELDKQAAALEAPYKRDLQHSGVSLNGQYMLTEQFGSGVEVFTNSTTSETLPSWMTTYSTKHGTATYGVKLNVGDGWAGGSVVASF